MFTRTGIHIIILYKNLYFFCIGTYPLVISGYPVWELTFVLQFKYVEKTLSGASCGGIQISRWTTC